MSRIFVIVFAILALTVEATPARAQVSTTETQKYSAIEVLTESVIRRILDNQVKAGNVRDFNSMFENYSKDASIEADMSLIGMGQKAYTVPELIAYAKVGYAMMPGTKSKFTYYDLKIVFSSQKQSAKVFYTMEEIVVDETGKGLFETATKEDYVTILDGRILVTGSKMKLISLDEKQVM